MSYARANRTTASTTQRISQAPVRSNLHAVARGTDAPEVALPGIPAQRQRLLRTLVETFGGEVTASALTRHLSQAQGWTTPVPGQGLTDVLRALEGLGAVDLEPNGEHDLIVRILPEGAVLYN